MYPGYKKVLNAHAIKALLLAPIITAKTDEQTQGIPLTIQKNVKLNSGKPVLPDYNKVSFEKSATKGANETLSNDSFVTDQFDLGDAWRAY